MPKTPRNGCFSSFQSGFHQDNESVRDHRDNGALRGHLGIREMVLAAVVASLCLFALAVLPGRASAAVTCPNPIPVVNENQCKTGTTSWEINDASPDLGGYTTKTSVNLGESVVLKVGRDAPVSPTKTVNIAVYRMGYYDGDGGRLVNSANNVAINNDFTCKPMDETTGLVDCGNWATTYTLEPAGLGRLPGQADRLHRRRNPGRLHRPRRQTQPAVEAALRPPDRNLRGLQHLRRQVAVLRHRGRQHRLRHQPRGQGLLQPALQPGRRRTRLALRARLQPDLLDREPGL
jgi:hypothetical protein